MASNVQWPIMYFYSRIPVKQTSVYGIMDISPQYAAREYSERISPVDALLCLRELGRLVYQFRGQRSATLSVLVNCSQAARMLSHSPSVLTPLWKFGIPPRGLHRWSLRPLWTQDVRLDLGQDQTTPFGVANENKFNALSDLAAKQQNVTTSTVSLSRISHHIKLTLLPSFTLFCDNFHFVCCNMRQR